MTLTSDPTDFSGVAVLVPCYNEAITVGKVVTDFAAALPGASIFVFDNNSTDGTAAEARRAGAIVVHEKRQGKGSVVAAMLEKVDADWYVMVDGDDTYEAGGARALLAPLFDEQADMVVAQRLTDYVSESFRPLHVTGNKTLVWLINRIFKSRLSDVMSGYRAFTREVAQSLPVVASGFDVETEMTLQLLYRRFVIREVPVPYRARPEGSTSKLRTFRDGFRVLRKIVAVLRAYRPLTFFGMAGLLFFLVGAISGYFPIVEYVRHRFVYSVPKAILAASCMLLSGLSIAIGVLLHTLNFRLLETTSMIVRRYPRADRFVVPPVTPRLAAQPGRTPAAPTHGEAVG